ncbi:Hypothetical predicted protein [Mytilus galloprovincialis]|uniref:Uncharacterized protein n=2 Tax=Mytilus galloprovincialis TaxID=29158 RepID=A0A8B6EVM5_MYTGA|nr:Hypothetical predicted protein [Mytilus galloprovincialis]
MVAKFIIFCFVAAISKVNGRQETRLSKENALSFLSRKILSSSKHVEYSLCADSYYCSMHLGECSSEEVKEDVCQDQCSYFQTCFFHFDGANCWGQNTHCSKIEPFKQGKGSFAFLMILTVVCISLIIALVVMCVKKYKKKRATSPMRSWPTYQNSYIGQEQYVQFVNRYPVINQHGHRQFPGNSGSNANSRNLPTYDEAAGAKRPDLNARNNQQLRETPTAPGHDSMQNIPPLQSNFTSS